MPGSTRSNDRCATNSPTSFASSATPSPRADDKPGKTSRDNWRFAAKSLCLMRTVLLIWRRHEIRQRSAGFAQRSRDRRRQREGRRGQIDAVDPSCGRAAQGRLQGRLHRSRHAPANPDALLRKPQVVVGECALADRTAAPLRDARAANRTTCAPTKRRNSRCSPRRSARSSTNTNSSSSTRRRAIPI